MTVKTQWITHLYDPLKPASTEPKEMDIDGHHLVYAAMLDGVRGKEAIADYTGICSCTISRIHIELAREGYIRLGKHNSRKCYMLWDEPNTYYKPQLSPEQVKEIGVLIRTRGFKHADLSRHFDVPKWAISDAVQGRKQYSEARV